MEEEKINHKYRIAIVVDYLVSEYSEVLIDGVMECGHKMAVDVFVFPTRNLT